MLRHLFGPALAGILAFSVSACDYRSNGAANNAATTDNGAAPVADIGGALYPDMPVPPPLQTDRNLASSDPIVLRCQVSLPRTQNVPSKHDGVVLEFCTDILPGEPMPPPDMIFEHPSAKDPTQMVKYRKLREGEVVRPGQLIAIMDNAHVRANYLIAKEAVVANEARTDASQHVFVATKEEYEMYLDLFAKKAAPESDVRRSKAQMERARAEIADAKGLFQKSREELNKAEIVLDEHEIRTAIGGIIKRFYVKPGESIRGLFPIAEVQNTDRYRIEGLLEAQYIYQLTTVPRDNLKVIIEPAPQSGFARSLMGHLRPVLAVAVSKDAQKPLIVSVSDDRTARVWDRKTGLQVTTLRHDVPVRAVACTSPLAAENLCITGADDGVVRLWDLDNLPADKPLRELGSASQKHRESIVCAAFAPDGQTCATADRNEIILWNVATGEMLYRFAAQHKGPITSIQFTPQSRLVSAARDRSMFVWKLGEKGAARESEIEHRVGDVPMLGVSPDGQRVLYDQERALHLMNLTDQRTEGVIPTPSEASRFSRFALFSPDGQMVLAAGTGDMPLQLWKVAAPGGRSSLIRRLAVGPTDPICAAFAPDGSFAVTGTQDNRILVWDMPSQKELDQQIVSELPVIDHSINPAERKARIWAELTNSGIHLLEGDTVTLVIPRPEGR